MSYFKSIIDAVAVTTFFYIMFFSVGSLFIFLFKSFGLFITGCIFFIILSALLSIVNIMNVSKEK